jgi:signal transduction histidine kinase
VLEGFTEPMSLAIDNARWFARLRTVGADEERTRIARDLHDRIGQSLAYLAFELDRITRRDAGGLPVTANLQGLRNDLRAVIGEVRDTLYDLRTDVSEDKDVPAVIEEYTRRVAERSGLEITVECRERSRLPFLQERELWRIAQEALTNVERHAHARSATVRWRCDGSAAVLEVADDGIGFPVDSAGRLDSYGILGMRERASSIGAALDIHSEPGEGTTVRCYLQPT